MDQRYPYKGEWFSGPQRNSTSFKPRMELTELQLEFIDWVLDPSKAKGTQVEWCAEHNISVRAVQKWKKTKLFTDEWEKRAAEAYGGQERLTKILDALFDAATEKGDVKAMNLYLQYTDRYTPTRVVRTEGTALTDLSDKELADLGENITRLRRQANG